jgi:histidyl-tRNA synthetase
MSVFEVPPDLHVATLTVMDKLDKIGPDGVRSELSRLALRADSVDRMVELINLTGAPETMIDILRPTVGDTAEGSSALQDLAELFEYVAEMGVRASAVRFDLSLVRGLGYYTGAIFETVLTESQLGSLGGGGRYDRLIGQFTGRDLPCVGISFGLDRILDALVEQQLQDERLTTNTQALVTLFSRSTLGPGFALAQELRAAGIRTEIFAEMKDLGAQLSFANKKGIPLVMILGPDEITAGAVVIRDLRAGSQRAVPSGEAVAETLAMLEEVGG